MLADRSRRGATAKLALAIALVGAVAGCGAASDKRGREASSPDTFAHVHGLGINPGNGALLIATHNGLFRAGAGQRRARRVGDSTQDLMGFTVVGDNHFLASGHPSSDQSNLPPLIGLIESRDGGRSWKQVSLLGQADFHVLRASGNHVYGFNSSDQTLMVSDDGGRKWRRSTPPGLLVDLVVDPRDPERLVASTDQRLFSSTTGGVDFAPLPATAPGLLARPSARMLYRIDAQGGVSRSENDGRSWRDDLGSIGGQPVAFMASGKDMYAALPDGTVKSSTDAGASWTVRVAP